MEKSHIDAFETFNTQINYRLVEALSEADLRFNTLIEQLNEIVFTLNSEGCFTFLNPAWKAHVGYEIAETMGRPIQDFVHPEDLLRCLDYFLGAPSSSFEVRFLDKHRNILWFEATVKPVFENKVIREIFGTFIDVTERVNAAEALNVSKERFKLAATASNDGIWDWNLLTNEVYFSPRWKEMLGYADDELEDCYATWHDRIHPDDLKETLSTLTACLEGKNKLYENVHRLKNKSGGWCWILDRGIVLRDAAGKGLRMAGSHADITQLKHIEEQLLERQQELNTIFSMSPDGIVTITPKGMISSVSPIFLSMTGFSAEELLLISEHDFTEKMASISLVGSLYTADESQAYRLFKIVPVNNEKQLDRSLGNNANANPSHQNMRVLKVTVCQLDNETISKIMYFRDVTAETEIDRMKSEFLSTAAHELRTPMSSVYGFTELLLTRDFDKETRHGILVNIHQQAESLVRMVSDLLDLAKIEARTGKEFKFLEQPLETVTKKAIAEFMMQGDARTINSTFTDEIHLVTIDFDQIKRALTNIISNAFKYSPEGGEVSISLCQRNTDEVGVLVKDHGLGMTQEQLTHVFERFWRGTNASHITGTGLGMSLVKEIMSFHQGHVEINSQPNQGTEVGLWFKLSQP